MTEETFYIWVQDELNVRNSYVSWQEEGGKLLSIAVKCNLACYVIKIRATRCSCPVCKGLKELLKLVW